MSVILSVCPQKGGGGGTDVTASCDVAGHVSTCSHPPTYMGNRLVLALLDLFKLLYFVTCTSVCKRVVFIQLQSDLVYTVFTMFVDLKTLCFKDCIETIQETLGSSSFQLFPIPWRIHVDNTFFFKFRMSLYIKK